MSGGLTPAIGDFPVGAKIAGYQIEQLVGRGGMASVYRARDVRLERQVALKVLAPELARDDAFRQRFIRESRSAASVDHPNIIPVFEAGEADGVLFIAMRFVTGQDVRALIERSGTLTPNRVVSIVTQVASALDAAHSHGLIHRDVKPANMLLASVGTATTPDHIYLSDFGLSKGTVTAQSLTGTGQFLGTVDYMSPEQVEGRPVDGRTDLYALGCTAFEMLTGEPPFRREQDLAVMWAQVSAPPPSVTVFRPDLPAAVDQVLAKALAKTPANRQASCMEFATELRSACAAGKVPLAKPAAAATEVAFAAGAGPALGSASGPDAVARQQVHPATEAVGMPPVGGHAGSYEETATESAVGAAPGPYAGQHGEPTGPYGAAPGQHSPGQYVASGGQYGGPSGPGSGAPGQHWPDQPAAVSSYGGQPPPPRRGKVVPVLIGLLVVAILAGGGYGLLRLRSNNNPQSGPTTPVTKTITASHSASSPPSSPASSSPGHPTRTAPAAVVTDYYNAVNNHNYHVAWRLNQYVHRTEDFQQFKNGFVGTSHTTLTIVSVSGDTVNMQLAATQTNGVVKHYQGSYTVQNGAMVASAVQCIGSPCP